MTHTQRLCSALTVASLFAAACQVQPSPPQTSSQPTKSAQREAVLPYQAALTSAMMQEAMEGRSKAALAQYQRLSKTSKAPKRVRALAMFHAARLLQQRGQTVQSRALAEKLRQRFPLQRDLHARLPASTPWPQRKLTLALRQVSYAQLLQMMAGMVKVKIHLKSPNKKKKISIKMKAVSWDEALRSIVWSTGDDIHRRGADFVVRPRQGIAAPGSLGNTIDLLESEIPERLKWIAEIARKSGLSISLRKSNARVHEQGLGFGSIYGRCRGSRQALINFLGRIKLLPFRLQVQTFQLRELGHGIVETNVYLGLTYMKTPAKTGVKPPTRPIPRPTKAQQTHLQVQQIRAVIRAQKAGVKRCFTQYRAELKDKQQHRLIVKMVVLPSGTIKQANVPNADKQYPKMAGCLAAWSRALIFPKAQKNTAISYPFVFTTK